MNTKTKKSRAQLRHQAHIDKMIQNRDLIQNWLMDLTGRHALNLDKMSPIEKHLVWIEEQALSTLGAVLNARVRFMEAQSRDANGEILHETPVLELDFIRGPKYFAKRKPLEIRLKEKTEKFINKSK